MVSSSLTTPFESLIDKTLVRAKISKRAAVRMRILSRIVSLCGSLMSIASVMLDSILRSQTPRRIDGERIEISGFKHLIDHEVGRLESCLALCPQSNTCIQVVFAPQ